MQLFNPLFSLFDDKFVVKKFPFDKKDYDELVINAKNAESVRIQFQQFQ